MAQAVLLSATLVSGATLHPCRLGLAGCALEPGQKHEDGSRWDTDSLPSIYEDGKMHKAEWADDPRKGLLGRHRPFRAVRHFQRKWATRTPSTLQRVAWGTLGAPRRHRKGRARRARMGGW